MGHSNTHLYLKYKHVLPHGKLLITHSVRKIYNPMYILTYYCQYQMFVPCVTIVQQGCHNNNNFTLYQGFADFAGFAELSLSIAREQ